MFTKIWYQSTGRLRPTQAIDAACAASKSVLDQATEKAQAAGVTCKGELLEDECVHSVIQAAHQAKADLIVAGSHGRTGISRAFLGSVAEGILRRADSPVLICHAPAVEPYRGPHRAIQSDIRRGAQVTFSGFLAKMSAEHIY